MSLTSLFSVVYVIVSLFSFLSFTPFVNTYNVLHISDIHYDLNYQFGAPDNCVLGSTGMRCCRNSSIPLDPWFPALPLGDTNCDSPLRMINETLQYVSENLNIDLILWTGDTADHNLIHQTPELILKEISDVSDLFRLWFPYTRIIPVLGNHDSVIDQDFQEMVAAVYDIWKVWVPEEFLTNNGNYYTQWNGFKLMCINSLIYDSNNIFNRSEEYRNMTQFIKANPFDWLVGHIPPGSGEAGYGFTEFFDSLTGFTGFFGHSHSASIRLSKNALVYITGSVMPDGHFPLFRVYDVNDPEKSPLTAINDFTDYMLSNLTDGVFGPLYSAKELYNLTDLTYNSWLNFSQRMATDQRMFTYYFNNQNSPFLLKCDQQCENDILNDIFV